MEKPTVEVIGTGVYSQVYRDRTGGACLAKKHARAIDRKADIDFRAEASMLAFLDQLSSRVGMQLAPRFHGWWRPRDDVHSCVFWMEEFGINAQDWVATKGDAAPTEQDVVLVALHTLAAVSILHASGVHCNDSFLRNVLVREITDEQKTTSFKKKPGGGVRYVLSEGAARREVAFTFPHGRFECILVDFGLASGEGLPVSHAERRKQFTLSDEEDVGKIHALENARLSSEQLGCIDILCLCVSLTRAAGTPAPYSPSQVAPTYMAHLLAEMWGLKEERPDMVSDTASVSSDTSCDVHDRLKRRPFFV